MTSNDSKWKDMSTVPLDGTRILVRFSNGVVHACEWTDDRIGGYWGNTAWGIGKDYEAVEWTDIP